MKGEDGGGGVPGLGVLNAVGDGETEGTEGTEGTEDERGDRGAEQLDRQGEDRLETPAVQRAAVVVAESARRVGHADRGNVDRVFNPLNAIF